MTARTDAKGEAVTEGYPNETLRTLFEKHAIRRYTDEPVSDDDLRWIVDAGLHAPSALGAQGPRFLVSTDAEINRRLGAVSRSLAREGRHFVSDSQPSTADDPSLTDAFYGAPVVVTVFTPEGSPYGTADATMAAANMMTAAWSLGLGSCFVSRARETFATAEGRTVLREAQFPEGYEAQMHVVLGHPATGAHDPKPLKPGRIVRI